MNLKISRTADKWIGRLFCKIIGCFIKNSDVNLEPTSILIIKLWAVGESVLTLPMIEAVKKKYPNTKITILARNRNKAVYEGQPFIDDIIVLELNNIFSITKRFKQFDLAIDCEPYLNISAIIGTFLAKKTIGFSHGSRAALYTAKIHYNDQQHVVKTYCDLATIINVHAQPTKLVPLMYSKTDEETINNMIKIQGIKTQHTLIGICPTTAETSKDRKWPIENYVRVIDQLTTKNNNVILIGTKNDEEELEQLRNMCHQKNAVHNFAGKTTLKQLFALIKKCTLFISNDTGPMHIAAAQGVKTIGIFGPNLPIRFGPYGKGNISLYEKQYCSPCINVHKGEFPACFNQIKGKCLKEIPPQKVMEAVKKCMQE
ncbi:glycosyltransferase family 9 protein [Candidatus Woesearchaeota archaeon]|nr:glycosyltransferase family 9 protein [Candidatus Woesearchaeota archaeon]